MKKFSMIIEIVFILLLIQNTDFIAAELYTSNAHLQNALYAEKNIASILHGYVQSEEVRLEQIKQLAEDYKRHSSNAIQSLEEYLGNPVNAFLLIKRLTIDWDRDVTPILANHTWNTMNEQIDKVRTYLPAFEDLTGAASAVMRLQDTYLLNTSAIAQGDLAGIKSPVLSAEDCFELGRLSFSDGDFYHTKLWMEQALTEYERYGNKEKTGRKHEGEVDKELSEMNRVEVLDYLAFSHYKLGDVPRALDLTNALLRLENNHERAMGNKEYFEAILEEGSWRKQLPEEQKKPEYLLNRDWYRTSDEFLTYEALCRGEETVLVKNRDMLTCHYVSNNSPLMLLQPVKEETLHLDPLVVVYHDVISDEEISQIKELATPKLSRATVHNTQTGQLETAHYRISKSAWLRENENQVVQKLNKRIAAITGLDLTSAEDLQVANYGLGGQYEPHFDFARKEEEHAFELFGTGNRIATFLSYMSDVEAGGATVFPHIGLKVYPKKGSAAFWYNLHKNGDGIINTRHAACPVLVGTKWIANKWIHERGQEFRRPCGMSADE